MIPVKHIDPDDLPLYAMGLLPTGEMAEMAENLQYSVEARKVLAEVYGELSLLAQTADREAPTSSARQRLMAQVAKEKKIVPVDVEAIEAAARARALAEAAPPPEPQIIYMPAPRSLPAKVLPWVGWAAAAALAVTAGTQFVARQKTDQAISTYRAELSASKEDAALSNAALETMRDPTALNVLLVTADTKPAPQGRVSYVTAKGSLVFVASNMQPLDAGKAYELWLIPSTGAPMPAGTFRPDQKGNGSVIMPELPKGVVAKAFGVTIENEGGSLVPTSPILMKGAAA